MKCNFCGIENKKLVCCQSCGLKGIVNTHHEIFEETVFDKLNPKLDEILTEIQFLKNAIKDFNSNPKRRKIKGL